MTLDGRRLDSSFPRTREGGFTFEVQQVTGKDLSRSFVVKTFSWSVIIATNQPEQALIAERSQISFSRQPSTHATNGILDATLLPGRMGIAEKGPHRQLMESVVVSELGAVIESDRTT